MIARSSSVVETSRQRANPYNISENTCRFADRKRDKEKNLKRDDENNYGNRDEDEADPAQPAVAADAPPSAWIAISAAVLPGLGDKRVPDIGGEILLEKDAP